MPSSERPYTCPECIDDSNTVLMDDYGPNMVIKCEACLYVYGVPKP